MNEKPLLRDAEVFPLDAVIVDALKDSFGAYQKFVAGLPDVKIDMACQRRFKEENCVLTFCLGRLLPNKLFLHGENPRRHSKTFGR